MMLWKKLRILCPTSCKTVSKLINATKYSFSKSNFQLYYLKNFNYKIHNLFSVIADFGGLLGLFMGCSLLSIVEVLFFITKSILEVTSKKSTKVCPERTLEMQLKGNPMPNNEIVAVIVSKLKTNDEKFKKMDESIKEILKIVQTMDTKLKELIEHSSNARYDNKSVTTCSLDEILQSFE
jgi:Amiloride-sensitive sodium channel